MIIIKYTVDNANKYIKDNKSKINKRYRHKFHLMPEVGWMNDPNGLNFFRGEYHVFYQAYPYDSKWGPMHWAHAKSRDMLNWEHLPVALAPDLKHEDGCFSGGSAVLDDKLYLLYTSHFETGKKLEEQSVAISEDGINFTKYKNKPVLTIEQLPEDASKVDFRDPNPVTIDGTNFVLIGSKDLNDVGQFLIYKTNDYINYEYVNKIGPNPIFGTMAECPDLFELDGKYVLLFSSTALPQSNNNFRNINSSLYMIGNFDSRTGNYEIEHTGELDLGHHFYAPQSLLNDKGERIMIAWMDMWGKDYHTDNEGDGWLGAQTLGRILSIENGKLVQKPIDTSSILNKNVDLTNIDKGVAVSKFFKMTSTFNVKDNITFKIESDKNNYFLINVEEGKIELDTSNSTQTNFEARHIDKYIEKTITIDLIMDNSSVELFVKGFGETITTRLYYNTETVVLSVNKKDSLKHIELYELNDK